MLKYENIIGQLTTAQKVRMLCDVSCLSDKEYRVLGIPEMKAAFLEDKCGTKYPSPYMMANSWDTELVGEVTKDIAKSMSDEGFTLAITPGAKTRISPYRAALSEDAVLSAELAGKYIEATKAVGLASCIKDFSLTADEIEWMDESPKSRYIYEYIVKPYRMAAKKGGFEGALIAQDVQTPNYEQVNRTLADIVSTDEEMNGAVPVCHKANMTNTVDFIANGTVCLEGVSVSMEAAVNKYKQLEKSLKAELITEKEIEEEIAKGHAISPEMVDAAVDRLLDFAFSCEKKRVLSADSGADKSDLPLRAARESIVLIKNENKILPLHSKRRKVCLIGDIAMSAEYGSFAEGFEKALTEDGYKLIGKERGYDINAERGEELMEPALDLAKEADIVFLFLGFDRARERRIHKAQKLSIPANQQVLLEHLNEKSAKIIAVIAAEHAPDFVLDQKLSAVLIAPINTESSPRALADIVSGKYSPCGRLASSIYLHTDTKLKKQIAYRKNYGLKSGPFMGYRYYDTADYVEGYAFGHGLGYSDFAYSRLQVKNGTVSVTVKNMGRMTASETVQIYIGMENSAVIRPKKELMAFGKAELAPGEKKTFTFPLELPLVFDAQSKEFLAEKGVYTVYAASSVSDVKLSCKVSAGDTELRHDGENKCDYLQSESNIITNNYKLEADCDIMKKSVFNIIAGMASLLMAVVLKAYCVVSNSNAMFFDVLAAILAVAGWIFFIAEALYRKKDNAQNLENIEEANAESFDGAEELVIANADNLFVKEFDIPVEDEVAVNVAENYSDGFGTEQLAYIDNELTFNDAISDFITAAKEKGMEFDKANASRIFSAMASSRIIVTNGLSAGAFEDLMVILGNYFESAAYIDSVDDTYTSHESVLFYNDAAGNRIKTHAKIALESAYNVSHRVYFVGLSDVKLKGLSSYFAPFVKHAKNPSARYGFTAHNERNIEAYYTVPQNVWFVLNLAEGESLADLPASIAEIASVNNISFVECTPSETHESVRRFTYYQMEYLCEKISSKFEINELTWKKVDKLEAFIAARAPYQINNKLWLCLEKYTGTYMACDNDEVRALDEALAAKVLPSMIVAANGMFAANDTGILETLEALFGEDNTEACKKMLKTSGADIA